MQILFLSRWFPYPVDNGSRLRIFNLLKGLSAEHQVDLISFTSQPPAGEHLLALGQFCRVITSIPYRAFSPHRPGAIAGLFSPRPRSVLDTYHEGFEAAAMQACQEKKYDLVIASQVDMALYALRLPVPVRLLEELELTTLYEQVHESKSALGKLRKALMWQKWAGYTHFLLEKFDGCTVVSTGERDRILSAAGKSSALLEVIPNGIDFASYQNIPVQPDPALLVFPGSLTYTPNFDAMDYFLREIFPAVQAACPEVRLKITGQLEGAPLESLPKGSNVILTGLLPDVRPAIAGAWAVVVPLRKGGGTRLKILEALALGAPVISTSKGAEGLEFKPGEDILIADTPQAFSQAVLSVINDPYLRKRLSDSGRKAVAARYDWKIIAPQLNSFINILESRSKKL